jgi:drug/metabolite transporter (DMT)-like permease
LSAYLGEIAALLTSLAFSVTSTLFTFAGQKVGSAVVNRTRLILAVLLLTLIHWFILGSLLPLEAEPQRWLWLGLSGIVGLVLGDTFLFQSFVWIGPRLSMLMMSLAPVIAALVAWIFLDEKLSLGQIAGIALTLAGIAWVVLERGGNRQRQSRDYTRGILFGLGAATGQALGLVLAKNGLGGDFSPISGNLIRMLTAMIVLWGITIFQRKARATFSRLTSTPRSLRFILIGAITGPVLGVSLSLFAVQQSEVGVASTLMALPPVFLLPISYSFFKERFGWGAIAGTFVAIIGVALLFLV